MSTLKTNNLQLLDQSRTIAVSKLAEMNGGFSFRNKIVDGRFDFWYEGTSQTSSGYGSDTMWFNSHSGSTKVHSQQPLVAGIDLPAIDCPSAKYFSRTVVTSFVGGTCTKGHHIEDVNTLAGKTVTLSFYAKADSVKNIAVFLEQNFGSGGSGYVTSIGSQLVSLSTTWKQYTIQINLPSISGKTVGSGSRLSVIFGFDINSTYSAAYAGLGQQSGTFDIACVQLEEGSVATPFEELPIEISQMRVNRNYIKGYHVQYLGYGSGTAYVGTTIRYPVTMRAIGVIVLSEGGSSGRVMVNDVPTYDTLLNTAYSTTDSLSVIATGTSAKAKLSFYYTVDARL